MILLINKFFIFLDTPSTNRILPLVRPSSLQITSRGRVALNITTLEQMNSYHGTSSTSSSPNHEMLQNLPKNSEIKSYSEVINYLSPEYVACIGKNANFSESDIEKVSFFFFCFNICFYSLWFYTI